MVPPVRQALPCALALSVSIAFAATVRADERPAPAPTALSGERVLRVVCDDNYPPYAFRSGSGEMRGIIPDHWNAWSKATGIAVDFRGLPWSACQEAMARGEADVIDSMFRTPERERSYDFLPPYADIRVPVFFHRSISGIARPEDLRGFRVAVKSGDACIGVLASYGVGDIVEYPDYQSIVAAAAREELRVFCIDEPPALYYIYQYRLEGDYRSALDLRAGRFHRALRKDRAPWPSTDGGSPADLFDVVLSGFDAIPRSTYDSIERRWFGAGLPARIDPLALAVTGSVLATALAALVVFSLALRTQVERKTADLSAKTAALEASERRNAAFIAALPDLFIVMDGQDRYYEVKTANPELLFAPEASLLGKTGEELGLTRELAAQQSESLQRARESSRIVIHEYDMTVPAGRKRFEARHIGLEDGQVLVIIRDITERAEAERSLTSSLREKELLLKEVHHRVKNNMQVISSLVRLEADSMAPEANREAFDDIQRRIMTMAQVHELLYRSDDLESIDLAEYLGRIAGDLEYAVGAHGRLKVGLARVECSMDCAVPLGLIASELITNAMKHAPECPIEVSLRESPHGGYLFEVRDSGPGLQSATAAGGVPSPGASLGLTLVRALAQQIGATLDFSYDGGAVASLRFGASAAPGKPATGEP